MDPLLTSHQLKNTKAHRAVLHVLAHSQRAFTIEEVFDELQKGGRAPNISTVYRILERFCQKGLAVKHQSGADKKHLYELIGAHKHYFVCLRCKARIPVQACPMQALIDELSKTHGLQVLQHHLELSGYCSRCKEKCTPPVKSQ